MPPVAASKKRKRVSDNQRFLNQFPDIPGVPMHLVPLLIEAIKKSAKFFYHSKCATDGREVAHATGGPPSGDSSALAGIMRRMNHSSSNREANPDEESSELEEHQIAMNRSVDIFLCDLKKYARRKEERVDTEQQVAPAKQPTKARKDKPVPLCCFAYVWDLQATNPKVSVRRAALHLSGLLLRRSQDCRFHVHEDSRLSSWVSDLIQLQNLSKTELSEKGSFQVSMMHLEADALLQYLIDEGYGDLYPKILVAQKQLRQQSSFLGNTGDNGKSADGEKRAVRDEAIALGRKEIDRVLKVLSRIDRWFEIVVPRVGEEIPKSEDSDDDEEDSVDWEDGDDTENKGALGKVFSAVAHEDAVARTIAAMQTTAGFDSAGDLEINFGGAEAAVSTSTHHKTLGKVQKATSMLRERHLPRISTWIDALINADDLVLDEGALKALPRVSMVRRTSLLADLSTLRERVQQTITAAEKLMSSPPEDQARVPKPEQNDGASSNSDHIASSSIRTSSSLRPTLSLSIEQRRQRATAIGRPKASKQRSNRIQIKYRKS